MTYDKVQKSEIIKQERRCEFFFFFGGLFFFNVYVLSLLKVHKKLSPYLCDMCHETFKRKKLLLEHIGKIHVSHGEAAKAMQAYIRKIEETGDDDDEELGQHTITIAPAGSSHHVADDGTTTVYAQVFPVLC